MCGILFILECGAVDVEDSGSDVFSSPAVAATAPSVPDFLSGLHHRGPDGLAAVAVDNGRMVFISSVRTHYSNRNRRYFVA